MRWRLVSLVAVLAFAGCPEASSDDDGAKQATGASQRAVALALTAAASFTGGARAEGRLPDATLANTVLMGEDAAVVPGGTTPFAFSGDHPAQASDPVTAALMLFVGADDHFEVAVQDAAVQGTDVSFSLEMGVDAAVCTKLCNRVFHLPMKHALKTRSGAIGQYAELTVTLDCSTLGKAELCGGGSTTEGGFELPFQAYEVTDQIVAEVCKACGTARCPTSTLSAEYRACMYELAERFADVLDPVFACIDDYYDTQLSCVRGAACDAALGCEFFDTAQPNPPALQACLVVPAVVAAEFDKCESLRSAPAAQ